MFESEAKHAEEVTKKGAGLKAILQIWIVAWTSLASFVNIWIANLNDRPE